MEILSDDGSRLRARVIGSERYRCELRGQGENITGSCSCPAFTDFGFCKHLVATALVATASTAGGLPVPDRFQPVRAHLHRLGETRLIEMILDLADHDPALFDRLEIAASAASGDPATLGKRLADALKRALHTGRFADYAVAGDWAQGVRTPFRVLVTHQVVDRIGGGMVIPGADRRLGSAPIYSIAPTYPEAYGVALRAPDSKSSRATTEPVVNSSATPPLR